MKIEKIKIENYRLLKDFSIDIEDELSLVIGKNNTGKTSLLSVLDKFLNQSDKSKFSFDDFNLDFKEDLKALIESKTIDEKDYRLKGIKLKLFIRYDESDNLSNISKIMMDLDPDNNVVVLGFEYVIALDDLKRLKKDFDEFRNKENGKQKKGDNSISKDINFYLKQNYSEYFKPYKKSIEYDKDTKNENDLIFIDLEKKKVSLKDIISFKYISAKREVTNQDMNETLSSQTSKIYKRSEASDDQKEAIEQFKDKLIETDSDLSSIYTKLFDEVVEKVKKFGGIKQDDSIIEIISTLQHRELLDGNTTVMYNHHGHSLPEHYNGLGYMNLISMIFEIEILIKEFTRTKEVKPADINLFFIEEPEAHTHPQMQYVFIRNIKDLLKDGIKREDGENRDLQYIISTHSSHIVSESDFNDIKYLKKEKENSVIAKNLKAMEKEYNKNKEEQNYRFLKQYLTLNRSELFFADKVILIEGDTERILLPAMMKKMDQESPKNPFLSQNISIVEVGAYSQIFEKFIDFIGIKTLIITDIDSYYEEIIYEAGGETPQKHSNGNNKKETKKCPADDPKVKYTSNNSLLFFHDKKKEDGIQYFINLTLKNKILIKSNQNWIPNENGDLLIAYQVEENGYHARSFEDSFFNLNKDFILDEDNVFNSLTNKWVNKFKGNEIDVFEFAEKAVGSKPSLAIEILLNSKNDEQGNEFSNWKTPHYIKECLEWLR